MLDRDRLYMGGEWVAPACPDSTAVVDSTTGDVITAVPGGSGAAASLNPLASFGGCKRSGNGRELGRFGLEDHLGAKSLQL